MIKTFIRKKITPLYLSYKFLNQKNEDERLIGPMKSFGDKNPDKTFLIIKINNDGLGLMGIFYCVLGYIYLANRKGYIPVIDLKNFSNGYLEKNQIGKVNAWDYYFEQPAGYNLEIAYQSKNVIIASGNNPKESIPTFIIYHYLLSLKKNKPNFYYDIVQNNMKLKESIESIINKESEYILQDKRVIGVVCRGSDIINAKGHSKQPTITDLINKTQQMLISWNCEYVFLASEQEETVLKFKDVFGEKLLYNKSARVKGYNTGIPYTEITFNRENDKYLKGLEYLTTVKLLSKCNCLIGSLVGATAGALGFNMGKYENVFIYDLGNY
jgi:hypothetical protein